MSSPLKRIVDDYAWYLRCFQLFLDRSSEHQCMQNFFRGLLPDVFASISEGRPTLNVLGVGSGSGEMDVEMLSQLCQKQPHVNVDYDVVEPSNHMLHKYKELLSKTPNLEKINFRWNQMTASEFAQQWKEKQLSKKMDFIHMIQMLYYVTDIRATISFFRSLLSENGKLLIIHVSGDSSWYHLWKAHSTELRCSEILQLVTSRDIKDYLSAEGIGFKSFVLPSSMDITECFSPGDENGELLLSFVTEVMHFSSTASAELKARVLACLRHPDCSTEVDGRVIFNNNLEALIVEP